MDNKFNFFVPLDIDLEKAKDKGSKKYDNMIVSGVASTDDKDTDGEILEPSGFETDRFLKSGVINLEHIKHQVIGEPIEANIKGNKFFVKGKLYKKSELARQVYDTLKAMKESGSTRKIGWSIEGKTLERDPLNDKRIKKALITNIALTFSPKNINTFADITKGVQSKDFQEYEPEDYNGGKTYLLEYTDEKGNTVIVNKDFSFKIKKAMDIANTKPLIKESLKKDVVVLANAVNKGIIDKNKVDSLKKCIKNFLSK